MKKTIINPISLDYIDQYEEEFSDFDPQDLEGGLLVAPFGDMDSIVPVGIVWLEGENWGGQMYATYNHSSAKYKYFAAEEQVIEYIESNY